MFGDVSQAAIKYCLEKFDLDMKCIELKVIVNVPDDYEYGYPLDVLIDENVRDDMEITNVEVLDEYDF